MKMSFTPKQLLLADAVGALLSGCMLLLVLPFFPDWFYMPHGILCILGFIAVTLFMYSTTGYFFIKKMQCKWLAVVMVANAVYGIATAALVWQLYAELSRWDLAYFLSELMLIMLLVTVEWRTVRAKVSIE